MARRIEDAAVVQAQLHMAQQLMHALGPRESVGVLAHVKVRLSVDDIWTLMLGGASADDSEPTSDAAGALEAVHVTPASPSTTDDTEDEQTRESSVLQQWYRVGELYWVAAPKSMDGVLGGLAEVHSDDIVQSRSFLTHIQSKFGVGSVSALDVGAGIGRVTGALLSHFFTSVDLLEQDPGMLDVARRTLTASAAADGADTRPMGAARDFFCSGIQDFAWPPGVQYDVVWLQWVVGCVLDVHLVAFLRAAAAALAPNGCIIVKDNHCRESEAFWYDIEDNSIARSRAYFDRLVEMAGLITLDVVEERDWDEELLPVATYALRARPSAAEVFRRNRAAAKAEGAID